MDEVESALSRCAAKHAEGDLMKSCESCGGVLELLERKGSLDIFRCASCGKQSIVHFSVAPEELLDSRENQFEVMIDLSAGQPSLKEVLKLRSTVPVLREASVESIRQRIEADALSLGWFAEREAHELAEKLGDLGLRAMVRWP